eukprot:TRINITY_DN10244_c0_g1_i1.p1 TRINITY_DN10244_c0_g1~~TRINITY_DN10244_c0_g1_i1.p1  ORF type:complete len:515 (+),score=125.46 TRINITY_DN10244_c0_g1_i1:138-1682(+)
MDPRLERILMRPENDLCADCWAKGPRWFSTNFGVLLCWDCTSVHRSLGEGISRIRSVEGSWTSEGLEILEAGGNEILNCYWEFHLVPYEKPSIDDPLFFRQRYIQSKYIFRDFTPRSLDDIPRRISNTYQLVEKKGLMRKKKLPHRGWKTRFCVLRGMYLNYFKKEGDSYPIGQINVDMSCSIRFCSDESISKKRHAILLRNSGAEYCLEPSNEDEAIDWIVSLRAAQYYSRGSATKKDDKTLKEETEMKIEKSGWLTKQGGHHMSWKKRFFTLCGQELRYHKSETATSTNAGVINLENASVEMSEHVKALKKSNVITLYTPARTFFLVADTRESMLDWVTHLSQGLPSSHSMDSLEAPTEVERLLYFAFLPEHIVIPSMVVVEDLPVNAVGEALMWLRDWREHATEKVKLPPLSQRKRTIALFGSAKHEIAAGLSMDFRRLHGEIERDFETLEIEPSTPFSMLQQLEEKMEKPSVESGEQNIESEVGGGDMKNTKYKHGDDDQDKDSMDAQSK